MDVLWPHHHKLQVSRCGRQPVEPPEGTTEARPLEWKALTLTLCLVALTLAGCIGEETTPTNTDGTDSANATATATDDTGAIEGKVFDDDLEKVVGASVALVQGPDLAATAETDDTGRYVLNGIAPGNYRLQVSAICCKNVLRNVDVTAGSVQTIDLSLEKLSNDDLKLPYESSDEWAGFYSCGVSVRGPDHGIEGAPRGLFAAACSLADETPLEDPNQDFLKEFNVSRGLKTLYVAMDWQPVGGVSGEKFLIEIGNEDCVFNSCSYEYAVPAGPPPLIVRIDNDDITEDEWKWDAIEDQRTLQYRVFPTTDDAGVVYQQPFTVYTHQFYWEEAPESFNPLPDA